MRLAKPADQFAAVLGVWLRIVPQNMRQHFVDRAASLAETVYFPGIKPFPLALDLIRAMGWPNGLEYEKLTKLDFADLW